MKISTWNVNSVNARLDHLIKFITEDNSDIYMLQELKTICSFCTKKATMAIRVDKKGDVETSGNEIKIGGNDLYKPVCRKHFRKITKLF